MHSKITQDIFMRFEVGDNIMIIIFQDEVSHFAIKRQLNPLKRMDIS